MAGLFNNLPILHKLLLISTIPLVSLILASVLIYIKVQNISHDEERLNNTYLIQEATAQYMKLMVDMETGFRGYVLTEDARDFTPYQNALKNLREIEHNLEKRLSGDQQQKLKDAEVIVNRFVTEKEELVRDIQAGRKSLAIQYIKEGRGRVLMSDFRDWMAQLEKFEQQSASDEFAQMSLDRTSVLLAILGGGLFTFGLMIGALFLIARSIAIPLANLSKAVGASTGELCPVIPVLDRKDEIGGLTRVMREMSHQVREHLDHVVRSEASLRILNQELAASESRYRGLVDHAPIGIFMTKGMQLTFSNRHNQVLAGLDPDKPIDPVTLRARIHSEDLDRVTSDFSRAVAAGRQCEMIFRFVHADGGVLTILSRRVPISGFDSPAPIYVGFNIDITALHTLQLRLSRTEKLATLGQVAAGIAHELRNPLVGIGSTASLLLDDFEPSDPRRAEVDVILQETKRLDRIVNQIVDYAKPRGLALDRFVLSDLINDVIKVLSGQLEAKHIKIRASLSAVDDHLYADRDQIKQVLINVIDNAIDASPMDGSVIEITANELFHHEQPGITMRIRDAGKGIPPEVLPRIFEPFFTSGKRHGTGLGMAICKNIIESHHGDIHLTSEVGTGTTVSIWMPLSQDTQLVKG
ncbi:MAG: CHASE3 domain-containing protein [Nitrospirae bacterium]|nr:CHASE3 domain-containing protein [Nitrospirota bacterium]